MRTNYLTILFIFLINNLYIFGQQVTKFVGIPIDGYQEEMIQKLEAKGFKQVPIDDELKGLDCIINSDKDLIGIIDGDSVIITVATNKNNQKITRVVVTDLNRYSAIQIKQRFNKKVSKFEKDKNYLLSEYVSNYHISDKEDIEKEMNINFKQYFVGFYQFPYLQTPLDSIDNREKKMQQKRFWELYTSVLGDEEELSILLDSFIGQKESRIVWFEIFQDLYDKFYIVTYYDNILNIPLEGDFYYGPLYEKIGYN